MREATQRQLDFCHDICMAGELSVESDKYGEPLFSKSFEAADKFIRKNKHLVSGRIGRPKENPWSDKVHPSDVDVPNY